MLKKSSMDKTKKERVFWGWHLLGLEGSTRFRPWRLL